MSRIKKVIKKKKIQIGVTFAVILLLAVGIFVNRNLINFKADNTAPTKNVFTKRYVLLQGSLDINKNIDNYLKVMEQAALVGYNGIVIDDNITRYWEHYNKPPYSRNSNRKIITDRAKELGLIVIPVGPMSDSMYDSFASKTTNWMPEAFPVQDTKFVVQGDTATVQIDPEVVFPNGGFEDWDTTNPNQPVSLSIDAPGIVAFRDNTVKHTGNSSLRFEDTKNNPDGHGHGRVYNYYNGSTLISVPKFRTYEASLWLKTENLAQPDSMSFFAFGYDADGTNERTLTYSKNDTKMGIGSKVQSTQEWTEYKILFNTLDASKIRIYLGSWPTTVATATGKFWFDDVTIKEIGLQKVVRRDSLPVIVKNADGTITYEEGKDYVLVDDGVLGKIGPYFPQYNLNIPSGSAILEGQKLSVSWYQYADTVYNANPLENMCHQEYWDKLTIANTNLSSVFPNAAGFFIGYDEWRVANWDPACRDFNGGKDMTGGEYMAYAMRQAEAIYKKPSSDLYVWSDMFDPYHNAVPRYYAVNGPVDNVIENGIETHKGSWEGLSPSTIVMNWNSQKTIDSRTNEAKTLSSLKFFANRGNHQVIAGYYDKSDLSNVKWWLDSLDTLESKPGGISGIDGFMYTSWVYFQDGTFGNFDDLEATANLIKTTGRWQTNSLIPGPTIAITTPQSELTTLNPSITISYTVDGVEKTKTFSDLKAGNNQLDIVESNAFDPSSILTPTTTTKVITVNYTAPTPTPEPTPAPTTTTTPPLNTTPTLSLSPSNFSTKWNMVSFPDLTTITNEALGLTLSDGFKIRKYDGGSNSYVKGDDANISLTPGAGYWLKVDDTSKIAGLNYPLNQTSTTEVAVTKGWNLLGNPFQSDLPLSNLIVKYKDGSTKSYADAITNKDVSGYAWSWEASSKEYLFIAINPDKYKTSATKKTTIAPFRGFWMIVNSDQISGIIINK